MPSNYGTQSYEKPMETYDTSSIPYEQLMQTYDTPSISYEKPK